MISFVAHCDQPGCSTSFDVDSDRDGIPTVLSPIVDFMAAHGWALLVDVDKAKPLQLIVRTVCPEHTGIYLATRVAEGAKDEVVGSLCADPSCPEHGHNGKTIQ